ncbi:MAG: 7-carboxy-7-deazaguanine synthase QueE [Elusimicrobiota bacterium]|nr:7-carboxy-7-deazaguanine synthase QueE [Elusimicrobiota bacterium]
MKKARTTEVIKGKITEIFFSLQGEGYYCGMPCWFVRFSGCDKNCSYCDTLYAKTEGSFMTVEKVLRRIRGNAPVVITGGEPTLQGEFLSGLLAKLKGRSVFIETSGSKFLADPAAFEHISFHAELPLSPADRKFIRNISVCPFTLKIVVTSDVKYKEVHSAGRYLGRFANSSIVLQPVTIKNKIDKCALAKAVLFAGRLQRVYKNVRVLPQIHKLLDLK